MAIKLANFLSRAYQLRNQSTRLPTSLSVTRKYTKHTSRMSRQQPTIPIVLCGKSPELAKNVTGMLKPEIEVIHVILNVQDFKESLPLILPSPAQKSALVQRDNIGSQDYDTPVQAVVAGAGYDDDTIKEMRTIVEKDGLRKVPWLTADLKKERPPLGPEYGKFVTKCVKDTLAELQKEGKLGADANDGGIYRY